MTAVLSNAVFERGCFRLDHFSVLGESTGAHAAGSEVAQILRTPAQRCGPLACLLGFALGRCVPEAWRKKLVVFALQRCRASALGDATAWAQNRMIDARAHCCSPAR